MVLVNQETKHPVRCSDFSKIEIGADVDTIDLEYA